MPLERPTPATSLSVVVPVFNERDNVVPLYNALISVLVPLDLLFEILFIDDGSRDQTFSSAQDLGKRDRRVKVISFSRNYGQTTAMSAGIDFSSGELIITLDGDLQNDPADIPRLLEKISEGYDIVVGWRRQRRDPYLTRILPSLVANWIISKVTGVPIRDNGCSLKVYRAKLIKSVPLYNELHRFIPAMTSLAGARIAQIEVSHHPRRHGTSKYGLSRIYRVLIDLLVVRAMLAFSRSPTTWAFGTAGVSAMFTAIFGASWLIWRDAGVIFLGLTSLSAALGLFLVGQGLLAQLLLKSSEGLRNDYSEVLSKSLVNGSKGVSR